MWLMEPTLRFNFPNNHTSFILYWPKCNCQCFYCDLNKIFIDCIPFNFEALYSSLPFIDCLVISGGESLLNFNDVLKFQRIAKENNLFFYVYTNGYNTDKIDRLLNLYSETYIVIDVKGNNEEQINETTKTKLGKRIMATYTQFANHHHVIFRFNEYIEPNKNYKNIERYEIR